MLVLSFTWAWGAIHWEDDFRIEDSFDVTGRIRSSMIVEGGQLKNGEFWIPGGESALRRYRIFRTAEQRLYFDLVVTPDPAIDVEVALIFQSEQTLIDPAAFIAGPVDITPMTNPGLTDLEIRIKSRMPEGSPPSPAIRHVRFHRFGPSFPVRWSSFAFFFTAATFFWILVAVFVLPSVLGIAFRDRPRPPSMRYRPIWFACVLLFVVVLAWLWLDPEWKAKKDYDDRSAVSNGATLLHYGYDSSKTFFRSRVRPAFPALIQPLLIAAPHRMESLWFNPSDGHGRRWYIYDQDNWAYGTFVYPMMSLMSMVLIGLGALVLYAIYRRLDLAPWMSLIATLLCILYFRRSLTIAVTQSVNFFINVVAMWSYLAWGRDERPLRRLVSGLVLGFAFLIKETAITTALAVFLFTLAAGPRSAMGPRLRLSLAFWLGAALWPLWYFGAVLDGGLAELFTNFGEHLDQQELNLFERLTPASAMRDLYVVFGVGLLPAAGGLIVSAARRFSAATSRLFLAWTVACLPVFTLPYIFPRFLQYFIPAFSFWTLIGLIELARYAKKKWRTGSTGNEIRTRRK